MSDTTQTVPPKTGSKSKVFIFGTAVMILAAGIGYQIFTANSADAVVDQPGAAGTAGAMKNFARVNDVFITYEEVAEECIAREGVEVLDNLINRAIIRQACEKRGVTVSDAEVTAEINRIAQKFQMPIETWYGMLQSERGLTPNQYREDVIRPMLSLRKLAGGNVQVTNQDLQTVFERDFGVMVKARMIMFDNFRRAQEIFEKARRNPEEFDQLAMEHSIEPNSRALGGTIPHIRRHSGNDQLVNAAFKLKPGQISGILEIDPGRYVILKCEGFTEPIVTDINQVADDLREQVKEEKIQEAIAKVFEQIRKEARVDNYFTHKSTGGQIKQTSGFQNPANVRPAAASTPGTATIR
ncbi:MAG TPA: peptidylprolyl isomerase [Planctomycetaceae bacterium]|nr:peptidylprolyl isomerase [Planctomycetaceae bacterium]